MAYYTNSKSEIVEWLKEAKESYQNSIEIIVENKKYLTKMFDDLSSTYDNLCCQTNENMEMIEKVLATGLHFQDPLATSTVLAQVLEVLKSSFNLPIHQLEEEMMIAKQKQLTEAQQVNSFPKFLSYYPF